ncbi:MAG TPA: translocation/assembly module TamB domain-containing protein, partial [Pseudomonadota bacterium]|nr:translocation/assembly module TamB domain-containing protein [Pseudomonadota bacterium]
VQSGGKLRIRFGEDPRGLFQPLPPALATATGGRGPACPKLAERAPDSALPLSATLRLSRALFTIRTVSDDGEDQRYLAYNEGDVLLCTDGHELEVGQAHFHSQRQVGERANAPVQLGPGDGHGPAALVADSHASQDSGEVRLRGLLGTAGSDLHILGQLRLELLEHLLRATFRHTHGEATVDVHVTGAAGALAVRGHADLRGAHLVPYDIDTPLDIPTGQLELYPDRASLHNLKLVVDGAETIADGTVELKSWTPVQPGQISFQLRGEISARLIQWKFARNLAEARGSLGLSGLRVSGSFAEPIVEGTLTAKDVFLNLRRFHELSFSRGTVRFVNSTTRGTPSRIIIGRVAGEPGGEPLVGLVDGDGKLALNGRIEHSGLGGFIKPEWHKALDSVRLTVKLDNVRHSAGGVYNFEATSPGLLLTGNRDEMHLIGDIEVVSGRYLQDFDLADRFLSARRVTEEEKPFWDGDAFLSALELNLNVRTRGTFRVRNNIADLRLATTGFTVNGPLVDIAMGGVIRVEGGQFWVPGLRGEFQVKGDSKIEFISSARWPDTPFVDVRGGTRDFDQNDQQRNIELALRGRVSELKVECLASEGISSADCASYLVLGDLSDTLRGGRSQVTPASPISSAPSARAIEYGDPAAKLVTSQLLTNQVADPLRQKLRLDTVRIQFGVSTFDVQLCKRFGLYVRMCGLAEWGILGNAAAHYRGFGELQMSDLTVGQISLERIERGFSFLEDTINRFKLQAGIRLPLRY